MIIRFVRLGWWEQIWRADGRTRTSICQCFLEDDEELERIKAAFESREMDSRQLKEFVIETLWSVMSKLQKRRAMVTDEEVTKFMDGTRVLRLSVDTSGLSLLSSRIPPTLPTSRQSTSTIPHPIASIEAVIIDCSDYCDLSDEIA